MTAHPPPSAPRRDPHSFARPDEIAVDHLSLDLTVDFEAKKLAGSATLRLARHSDASALWLDARDLDIHRVTLQPGGTEAQVELGDERPHLGRPIAIEVAPDTTAVHIEYSTRPEAAALQWLDPAQAGSARPLLFTQSEAILARTWVPCQDSPGVRMTYDATIRVPSDLLALMSAENPQALSETGTYTFRMPQAISSYLLALAVGDLAFRPFDASCGIYALPSVIEKAHWELTDTPRMVAAAEKLYGPYRWGRYDLLILPASYPFGGMENPRLTFATPTILAGDRSLVSLIAHELAHSWSGNLVTNASWDDFWLNEGFTTYFERRIMEEIYGRPFEEMEQVLAMQDLAETVELLGGPESPDTCLRLDLAGRNPDDGMTDIAYEKGALFLRWIEENVGRARWDAWVTSYFDRHAFRSVDTATCLADLRERLIGDDPELEKKLEIDAWVFRPGVPANRPQPRSDAFDKVAAQVAAFQSGTAPADLSTHGWSTHEWLHFIRNLAAPLDLEKLAALDARFRLTESANAEILAAWLLRAIEAKYRAADGALEYFLTTVGRRKFLKPLYAELAKTPDGLAQGRRIYEKARPTYHSISRGAVDGILELN